MSWPTVDTAAMTLVIVLSSSLTVASSSSTSSSSELLLSSSRPRLISDFLRRLAEKRTPPPPSCAVSSVGFVDAEIVAAVMEEASLPVLHGRWIWATARQQEACLLAMAVSSNGSLEVGMPDRTALGMQNATVVVFLSEEVDVDRNVDIVAPMYLVQLQERVRLRLLCPVGAYTRYIEVPPMLPCPNALSGGRVSVSVFGLTPYIIIRNHGRQLEGTDIDIMAILASKLGFRYEYRLEREWIGFDNKTGLMVGSIGHVVRNLSTFGIGHSLISWDQNLPLDFLVPCYSLTLALMTRKPKPLPRLFNILHPFSKSVWALMLATLVIVAFALTFLTSIPSFSSYQVGTSWARERMFRSFILVFSGFVNQSSPLPTKSTALMCLLGTWFVYLFLIREAFECNLRGYLIQTDFEDPIEGNQDLYDTGQKLYLPKGTIFTSLYLDSPFRIDRVLGKQTVSDPDNQMFDYDQEGTIPIEVEEKIIATGGGVLHAEQMIAWAHSLHRKRHGWQPFRTGQKRIANFYSSFMVGSWSVPWRHIADWVVSRLVDSGVVAHLIDKHIQEAYIRDDGEGMANALLPLGLEHFYIGLLMWTTGIISASTAFMLQILRKKIISTVVTIV